MKLKSILLLLILVVAGIGGGYIYQTRKNTKSGLSNPIQTIKDLGKSTPTPEKEFTSIKSTYFVPVTGLKAKRDSITTEELLNQKELYLLKDQPNFLSSINRELTVKTTELASIDELALKLNSINDSIGLIPFDKLSFKVKTLAVDSISIFDKKADLTKYPLKLAEEIKSKTEQKDISNFEQSKVTKFGHTGSMIPARGVQYWTENKFNNDYTHIFKPTKPLFDTFDYLSSTFEISLQGNGKKCDSCLSFVGPEKFMEGVKYSGINFYTMASNHIMDGGVEALANTQKLLDEAGIKYTGASTKNNDDAGKPVLVEVNGIKIAYLGFNDTPGLETWARDNKPGAASISDPTNGPSGLQPNEERIKYFLQRAKDLKPDQIFVLMHWNHQEYKAQPLDYTRTLANLLVKHGADVVLGDHPHWVQEIEFKGEIPVFYSMGNYIFDQMWSTETRQGMTVELNYYDKKLVNFRLHPHQLNLYDKGTVDLLTPNQPEYQQTLDRVWNVSNFTKP